MDVVHVRSQFFSQVVDRSASVVDRSADQK